ncbi:MAG: alpha/beta hydrolase [Chloroflexi bacterium]|nr:alpha/beta hydrolase [Chloroflexota bacterium]
MPDANEPDYALLDRLGAASMAFFPRPDHTRPPEGATDYLIEVDAGVSVGARFYHQPGPEHPSILYFHGNGEIVGDHDQFVSLYYDNNINLFVAEFRGYGKSGGNSSMEHLVTDARPVAAFFHAQLDELGYSKSRYAMGRSMGASPALEIAANAAEGFGGVVIESGAAGVRGILERFGVASHGTALELIEAHEEKIRSIRLPTMQIHGEVDQLVPMETAAELYNLLEGTSREIVVIPYGDHNTILWVGQVPYMEALRRFIDDNAPAAD